MDKEFNYNIKPIYIAIGATLATAFTTITSDFGRKDLYYQHGNFPIIGTFIIVMFLVLPIFFKGYREYIWTKKGLITLLVALAINLPIGVYCIINHYNLFGII